MKERTRAMLRSTTELVNYVRRAAVQTVLADIFWFLLLAIGGIASLITGVRILAGNGWALIAAGALCICAAAVLRRGMNA